MAIDFFGWSVDVDYRGRLATAPGNPPSETIPINRKRGQVVHYAGGAQNRSLSALARWQAYARNHISPGRFYNGTANGLMYHMGVDEDGRKAALFDPRVTRWHAGSTPHNRFWVSYNIPIGGNQDATYAQKVGLEELLHEGWKLGVGDHTLVIGHQEASRTLCPGVLQNSFVIPVREGEQFGKDIAVPKHDHVKFDVPGLGTFWIIQNMFKRWSLVEEPLFLFGWPVSGMTGNDTDGYIQNFERARFEWRPGSWPNRHDVHLGRVGAELCSMLYPNEFDKKKDMFKPMTEVSDGFERRYFKETQMLVQGNFKKFWDEWGGVEYFGFPISREFVEGGKTVQYFERARLEHHPDSSWASDYYNTALGRVNAELLDLLSDDDTDDDDKVVDPPTEVPLVSLDSWIPVAKPVDVNVHQITEVCYQHGRQPQYTKAKIRRIAEAIISYSDEFGFRTSLCAAQIMHETGFFRYGGQVQPDQNNFAGLGATNDGAAGASFPDEDEGVLAVMCHLALYVYGDIDQWPEQLRKYADKAIRRDAVRWAHNNVRKPDGTRLLYLGTIKRIRDFQNGRWAQTDSVPLGTLENGYARALVRVTNEILEMEPQR